MARGIGRDIAYLVVICFLSVLVLDSYLDPSATLIVGKSDLERFEEDVENVDDDSKAWENVVTRLELRIKELESELKKTVLEYTAQREALEEELRKQTSPATETVETNLLDEPLEEEENAELNQLDSAIEQSNVESPYDQQLDFGENDQVNSFITKEESVEEDQSVSEELLDDEDEDEGEEIEEISPRSPVEFGYEDLGGQKFKLLSQSSKTHKKHFKSVGTKFLALFKAFEHAGWKHRYEVGASVGLYLTKPITKVYGSSGKMISQISRSSCIGGSKGAQLRCKVALAQRFGCSYEDLEISPSQYNLHEKEDCTKFMERAMLPENADKTWIFKDGGSYHGKNIKFYKGLSSEIKRKYGKCNKNKVDAGVIMMDYISNPVLFSGKKFDLRTYLLIASTKPYLVFYHPGFIRRSGTMYSNSTFSKNGHITNHKSQDHQEGHFWSFAQLSEYLKSEEDFPENFMETHFKSHAKHVTNFVFQAARETMRRRGGAFMLFGLDWMIDADQNIHFLEANGNPTIQNYEGTGLGPLIWNEMADLVTKLHREPEQLGPDPSVSSGFRHGGWELVFNEAEELISGKRYNACHLKKYKSACQNPNKCAQW